jgi:uncharacterized protein
VALALVAWLALPQAAQAAPPAVADQAGLLSSAQEAALTSRIAAIQQQYDFNVVIRTVPSLNGQAVDEANKAYFAQDGDSPDAISFLVSLGDRRWNIWATPGYGQTVFTDYGREVIGGDVQTVLSAGDYYAAFDKFLDYVEQFLHEAKTNRPYDTDHRYLSYNPYWVAGGIGAGVGVIGAGATVLVWKRKLKTARPATEALAYQVPGSLQYSVREDQLVNSHTTVVPIPQNNSRGFGGGGMSSGVGSTSGSF